MLEERDFFSRNNEKPYQRSLFENNMLGSVIPQNNLNFGEYSNKFLKEWRAKGYMDLKSNFPQEEIEKEFILFSRVLKEVRLEERLKMKIEVPIKNNPKSNEFGFYRKVLSHNGDDQHSIISVDNKEWCQYHPLFREVYFNSFRGNLNTNERDVMDSYLLQADKSWRHFVFEVIEPFYKKMDKTLPGIYSRMFNERGIDVDGKSLPIVVGRDMEYQDEPGVEVIGKPHYDRGALSFRVGETQNGFYCGHDTWNLKHLQRVDNKKGTINVFAGNATVDILPKDMPHKERIRSGHGAIKVEEGEITLKPINPMNRYIKVYFSWPTELTDNYEYRATAEDEL